MVKIINRRRRLLVYKNYLNIVANNIMQEIKINTEFIKLDSFLKWCGAVVLGSEAKIYILEEEVLVNNEICTQRGKKLKVGDIVEFQGEIYKLIK